MSQIADEGARYTEKERRHACHSSLKDFTTTLTETQGGTGGNMHNFNGWDIPLVFKDGRPPDEVDLGTMKNRPGCMMVQRESKVLRVDALHRRDHSHRRHRDQVPQFNRRRCQDHRQAEEQLRQLMRHFELDLDQHRKITLNKRGMKTGLQTKIG